MSEDRFWELMDEAEFLPNTPTRVAMLEEAAREADHLGNAENGFMARSELVTAATFSGLREKAMVAYSWCLAHYDRNRDDFDEESAYDLLWQYKWILGEVTDFPQISRAQIVKMEQDMQRRYADAGYNDRPVYYYRHQNALYMGDIEAAREFREQWLSHRRDDMADCDACECSTAAELFFVTKDDSKGLKTVAPILRGKLTCNEIPHTTYSDVLMPMTRVGRVDEAHRIQQRGYRMISNNRDFLPDIARHMLFLTHHGEYNKPTRMFAKHFAWAFESAVPEYRFQLYLASAVLFEALARKTNRKRKLRLPSKFPLKSDDDAYEPGALAEWLAQETHDLVERFNARNGNDYYTTHVNEARETAGLS